MSPLERILLAAHEERMAATAPKDLPMSASAKAAKAMLTRKPASRDAEAERKRRCQRAMRDAVLAESERRRQRSLELLSKGVRFEVAAEACDETVRSLVQVWMAAGPLPEVVRRAREDYNARQYAVRLASRREYFRSRKARMAAEASP